MSPLKTLALLAASTVLLIAATQPYGGATPTQQLFVLKELKPNIERVGIVWKTSTADTYMADVQRAGAAAGVQVVVAAVGEIKEVAPSFRNLLRDHQIDALWVIDNDGLMDSDVVRKFLIKSTLEANIPLLVPSSDWVEQGASLTLTSSADGVALIVNQAAANALALTVPEKYKPRTQFFAAN